jgi:hypothetical protein
VEHGGEELVPEPLAQFLDRAHEVPPDLVCDLIESTARALGAETCRVWLADYQQRNLVHLGTDEQLDPVSIDGSVAGRAFITRAMVETAADELWYPLLDGVDRIGVLEVRVADDTPARREAFRHLATIGTAEIVTRGQYTDRSIKLRRMRPTSLAAELQWQDLPPSSFATDQVAVAGMLEPAYEVGGDTFDYAYQAGVVDLAIFDAVGHTLSASLIATLALGCYRNCRRRGDDLAASAAAIDEIIRSEIGKGAFTTAQLGRLDTTTGRLRWVNAGHPLPLLVRDGHVHELTCSPSLPLGLNHLRPGRAWTVAEEQLEPGDGVLFYTDGVIEAQAHGGEQFGVPRLREFATTAFASGLAPAEILRRLSNALLDFHDHDLRDDATTFLVTWRREPPPASS